MFICLIETIDSDSDNIDIYSLAVVNNVCLIMSEENENIISKIQLGEYIIIQRQKYTKLCKFEKEDSIVVLGKEKLHLGSLLNQPYGGTYKMVPMDSSSIGDQTNKQKREKQRLLTLELCNEIDERDLRSAVGVETSGQDNRNIIDDGESQALGPDDIEQLKETYNDSTKIIEKIVQNSKTFSNKTEYSQEKYLKKKEKKYFEFVQIHQPTLRLISQINFRVDPEKIMSMRCDILSQLLCYANVCAFGKFLLYESGTQGLLPASFLNAFGQGTEATLVHMFPGNMPQRNAIYALNLPAEQVERCISVNIYSALRSFCQNSNEQNGNEDTQEPSKKKIKRDENSTDNEDKPPSNKQKWEIENERACQVMHEKFDSLVIASKEHPLNILRELLPLMKPSRPVVVYSQFKEILVELYNEFINDARITNLHIVSNFMRMYQILPNRTHPEINMNNDTGFLLYGYTLAT